MPELSSRTRRRIKLAVSLALVAGLLYLLDLESLASAAGDIEIAYVLLAFVLVITNRILMPVKWNLLLRARGIRISHFSAVRVYTLSSFLGLVLPPTLGADSIRSYYMKNAGVKLSDTLASIVIERVFGLLVLLAFTVLGFFLLITLLSEGDTQVGTFAAIIGMLSIVLLAGLYLSFTPVLPRLADAFSTRLQRTRWKKLASGADAFVRAYQEYRHTKRILAFFSLLTILELTLTIVRSYIVAMSLGIDLPVSVYFAFLPLVTLLNRMPISFDGFGINESLFIYFLALFGVMPETAFLIGLINHLLFIVGIMPGGVFYVLSPREEKPPEAAA